MIAGIINNSTKMLKVNVLTINSIIIKSLKLFFNIFLIYFSSASLEIAFTYQTIPENIVHTKISLIKILSQKDKRLIVQVIQTT